MNEVTYWRRIRRPTSSRSAIRDLKPAAHVRAGAIFQLTDEETTNFRTYLLKGFVIVDDFRFQHWEYFEAQMRRVLPDVRFFDLETHLDFSFVLRSTTDGIRNLRPGQADLPPRHLREQRSDQAPMVIINYNTHFSSGILASAGADRSSNDAHSA
jgi:hypothetical protein